MTSSDADAVAPPDLTVVVPTYDERDNVAPLCALIHDALAGRSYEILYVDDDSPDGTADAVRDLDDPRVRVLVRTSDKGLSKAVIAGFEDARGELVAVMDADLQHDPAMLLPMLDALDAGADLVVASRFLPGGDAPGLGRERLWMSVFGIWVVRLLTGAALADPFSGYFLTRRETLTQVRERLTGLGFKILLDLVLAHGGRLKLVEVPAVLSERHEGTSKFGLDTVVALLAQMLQHRWRRLTGR